jgi:CheY-like chemotaxis protein
MDKLPPEHPVQEDLKEIFNAALQSAKITRQLLAFARKQTIRPKVLHLNETLERMLKILSRLIGENIDLEWLPGKDLHLIEIDPTQLDQILTNLCVNARGAINGVGKITIETSNVYLDENHWADRPSFIPGDFVMLAVSDDGCGMEKDIQKNLFEPFFTTKGLNEGTGLGLSTVYGIVKQNKGFIDVFSEPQKGSTFRIYLPRHDVDSHEIPAQDIAEVPLARGETVLVVEDEAANLNLLKTVLKRLGYTVLDAATPGWGLTVAKEHKGHIDLLITDVVLPEMNGKELADQLSGLFPDLKILFISGYNADVIVHQGIPDEGINFMQKPFSNRDLALKVRAILDNGG